MIYVSETPVFFCGRLMVALSAPLKFLNDLLLVAMEYL
jgi:hypothetical protein